MAMKAANAMRSPTTLKQMKRSPSSSERSGRSGFIRFPSKLPGPVRENDAWKHAGRPDMDGLGKVDRLVQRTALDAQSVGCAASLVPKPGATLRTKCTVELLGSH